MDKYRYSKTELDFIENSSASFAVYQFLNKRIYTIALSGGFLNLFELNDMSKEEAYDLMDNNMYRDTHPDDRSMLGDAGYHFATTDGTYDVLYRSLINDEYHIIHAYGTHMFKENHVRLALIWYSEHGIYKESECNESDEMLQLLRNQLMSRSLSIRESHDYLTGLPSMTYFFELAGVGCRDMRKSGQTPTILFMDFNGMKGYNQKLGLQEGDKYLKHFSDVLIRHFSHDNCSRLSADHFCVFTEFKKAQREMQLILEEVSNPAVENRLPLRVGLYRYDDESISISGACDRAKIACDSGRNNYESRVYEFSEAMMKALEKKQYIVENFDKALREGWIQPYYQPAIRTANSKICAEETLARWQDPEKGMLNPVDFIPALEEANCIHKLDLYVLDRMLEKMNAQADAGYDVVPHSVNLSRLDFYACDIVDEIRSRVDAMNISRDRVIVEITESVIASDIHFMTKEIKRFKELGFMVWMDDYGSGYSSPEILQDLPFDVVKIDRLFVQNIENSSKSKIILAEIIKMAISLGMDTIAEGVETIEQVNFLKEIGCTMLQGFYYCKPLQFTEIMQKNCKEKQLKYENPKESGYYSQLGRVNLYDLSILRAEDASLNNYFDTWPMVMVECDTTKIQVIRYNKTFKDFAGRNFPGLYGKSEFTISDYFGKQGVYSLNALLKCGRDGKTAIVDDRTTDGKNIQLLVWKVATNPITRKAAVMAVVLAFEEGESDKDDLTYNYVARALSQDYVYLFFVDLDTDDYTAYLADGINRDLSLERRSSHFFEDCFKDAKKRIYQEDQQEFFKAFNKKAIVENLRETGSYTIIYRHVSDGEPKYRSMKITRLKSQGNHIIIGVNNIDAQMKEKEALEQVREEHSFFIRMVSLYGDFMSIYTVDPATDEYYRYSSIFCPEPEAKQTAGSNFYAEIRKIWEKEIYEEDQPYFFSRFKKEIILNDIRNKGKFIMNHYRLLIDGRPVYVILRATMIREKGKDKILMGIINVNDVIRKQEEYEEMEREAMTDELTGVKRKHAYQDVEKEIDKEIITGKNPKFAVAVFDINGLKEINDTYGHQMGDQYIIDGCKIISKVYRNSPIYRLGGDEFAIIARGADYARIDELMEKFLKESEKNRNTGGVVVAAGMSKYVDEKNVAEVFRTADKRMYKNKEELKR